MTSHWKQRLSEVLRESRRLAFVGVGQDLRGDDAAGILLVRRLQQRAAEDVDSTDSPEKENPPLSPRKQKVILERSAERLYFEAGSLPEASAGPLRRFGPDFVIFLDAAQMGEGPGTVGWIEPGQIDDGSASTHTFPMGGFAEYLSTELGCRVAVLGIQPEQMEFDAPATEQVLRAIEEIAARIAG
jgi:hydrogenase 3 maturation protease